MKRYVLKADAAETFVSARFVLPGGELFDVSTEDAAKGIQTKDERVQAVLADSDLFKTEPLRKRSTKTKES